MTTGAVLLDDGERIGFKRLVGIDGKPVFMRKMKDGELVACIYFELPEGGFATAIGRKWRLVAMDDGTEIRNPEYGEAERG